MLRKIIINLVIIFLSFIITLYTLNIISFVYYWKFLKYHGVFAKAVYKPIMKLRSEGKEVYPTMDSNFFFNNIRNDNVNLYSIGNISNSILFSCIEYDSLIYETDEHGFNNPKNVIDPEILVLGDSFAEGQCVDKNKGMVSIIRNVYPNIKNLARGGSGTLLELATMKEYGSMYSPKITLLFYFEGNDLQNNYDERKTILKNYLKGEYALQLTEKQNEINILLKNRVNEGFAYFEDKISKNSFGYYEEDDIFLNFIKLKFITNMIDLRAKNPFELIKLYTKEAEIYKVGFNEIENINYFGLVLSKIKDLAELKGGRLLFVYLPDVKRYVGSNNEKIYMNEVKKFVIQKITELNIKLLDITPIFDQVKPAENLWNHFFMEKNWGHYNEKGHEVVGKAVIEELQMMRIQTSK